MLETEKPDIVVGTESWLTPDISNSEIIPKDLGYNIFREDRTTGTGGGVRDGILVSEQKHFKTESDCEIVWVRVDVAGSKLLFIAIGREKVTNTALQSLESP